MGIKNASVVRHADIFNFDINTGRHKLFLRADPSHSVFGYISFKFEIQR